MKVAVVGATGFVGSAARRALVLRGAAVVAVASPRLPALEPREIETVLRDSSVVHGLAKALSGCDVVVNAAGNADASSRDFGALVAANAALPLAVARAARGAEASRYVHVSSAAVQGRRPVLDESSETEPFSPYSHSKALAEELLLAEPAMGTVIYRPPSVHGADRHITRSLVALATSPASSVCAPGTAPTPHAHIDNVGDAIAFLATCLEQPASIVMHPWEGLTTASLLHLLGGREPRQIPPGMARGITWLLRTLGSGPAPLAATARRLDLVWYGQGQATSWLEQHGWSPPARQEAWARVADEARARSRPGGP